MLLARLYKYCPHSLGKLVEWKGVVFHVISPELYFYCPHSLGKLVEWKVLMPQRGSQRNGLLVSPLAGEIS